MREDGSESDGADGESSYWSQKLIHVIRKKKTISEEDRIKKVNKCLINGAKIDAVDDKGNTALHLAVERGYLEIVRCLVENRAKTDIQNSESQTAFTLAKARRNKNILDALRGLADGDGDSASQQIASTSQATLLPDSTTSTPANHPAKIGGRVSSERRATRYNGDSKNVKKRQLRIAKKAGAKSSSKKDSQSVDDTLGEKTGVCRKTSSSGEIIRYYAAEHGAKVRLSGYIYQLKLLMLFLWRGLQLRYQFSLATEMDEAEKFDDLVFQYKVKTETEESYRFLQAKYKQDETQKIKADALSAPKGDFSLQQFFISCCAIKDNFNLKESTSKDLILCTNIDFDFEGLDGSPKILLTEQFCRLEYEGFVMKQVDESDDFLEFKNKENGAKRYKFCGIPSKLRKALKQIVDFYELAEILLVEHVFGSKEMKMENKLFKRYHIALAKNVIDVPTKKFFNNFIEGQKLSGEWKNFWEIFRTKARKLSKKSSKKDFCQKDMWKEIAEKELELPPKFGQHIESNHNDNDDNGDNGDIEKFFKALIFAVHQPDEIELDKIITEEIGTDNRFNLLTAELVSASFQKEILGWFKEIGKVKEQEGRFYSHDDATQLFGSMKKKVDSIVNLGLSLSYREELEGYGIKFVEKNKKLENFLKSDSSDEAKSALNLIAALDTLPTAIRVQQAIQQLDRYKKDNSLMFLRLRTLQSSHIEQRVTLAFRSLDSHHLLVIDCESATKQDFQGLYGRLRQTMGETMNKMENNYKKLIFITRDNEPPSDRPGVPLENCSEIRDNVSFKHLTTDSQLKLVNKEVISFQGYQQRTSFGKLLDIRDGGDIVMRDSRDAIDTSTLVKLIRHDEIKIGSDLQGLGEVEKYYVDRRIDRRVIIKDDIFKSQFESDVFAMSTSQRDVPKFRGITLRSGEEAESFGELCDIESRKNVHWLKYESGKFIWYRSRGDITILMKYRDVSGRGSSSLTEDQLAAHDDGQKVVIISDSAGNGKTTMLTYLAEKIREKNPGYWVIRINLNDFTDALSQALPDKQLESKSQELQDPDASDSERAVKFFVEKLSKLEAELDRRVLKSMMEKKNCKVILLFDGFDEISPDYTDMVIYLLEGLKKIGVQKLIVATRPHMRPLLEEKLRTFSFTMELFSKKDRIDFLIGFWKAGLRLDDVDRQIDKRLRTYANELIKRIVESIRAETNEMFSVPLLLWIIAELFQGGGEGQVRKQPFETCAEYLKSENDEPKLDGQLNVIDLYGTFVKRKFKRYCTEKTEYKLSNVAVRGDIEIFRKNFSRNHQKLALHTLFNVKTSDISPEVSTHPYLLNQTDMKEINALLTKISKGLEKTGIITHVVDGRAQFIHRTFAEYFAAKFIQETLLEQADHDSDIRRFLIQEILLRPDHDVIRSFLNGLLPETSPQPDDQHAGCAVARKAWKVDLDKYDHSGDTIFHIAAQEDQYEIMKFFLNRIDQYEIRKNLSEKVGDDKRTVLRIATDHQQWGELKWLIKKRWAEATSLIGNGRTLLHAAASRGNLDMVKWLIDEGALVDALDDDDVTVLHCAAQSRKWGVVQFLTDSHHEAVRQDYETVMFYALRDDIEDTIEWLMKDPDVHVSLKDAIEADNMRIVDLLIGDDPDEIDDDGYTPLCRAVDNEAFETLEYLLETWDVDVNKPDLHEMTALHYAAQSHCGMIKTLVEHGADISARNEDRETPLDIYGDGSEREYLDSSSSSSTESSSSDDENNDPKIYKTE